MSLEDGLALAKRDIESVRRGQADQFAREVKKGVGRDEHARRTAKFDDSVPAGGSFCCSHRLPGHLCGQCCSTCANCSSGCLVQLAFMEVSRFDFDAMPVMLRRLTLRGSTLRARSSEQQKAGIVARLREKVWPVLEQGRALPVIHAVFPLDVAAEAHSLIESSRHIGKIMLQVKGGGHAAR